MAATPNWCFSLTTPPVQPGKTKNLKFSRGGLSAASLQIQEIFSKQIEKQPEIKRFPAVLVGVSLKDLVKPSKINGLQAASKVRLS